MPAWLMRWLPWIVGGSDVALAYFQWRDPAAYPAPLVIGFTAFLAAAFVMLWRQVDLAEAITNLLPTCFAMASIGLAFLLVEESYAQILLAIIFGIIPLITLELLFVNIFEPARYPINGMSHWNLILIPLMACCLGLSLNGLLVFIYIPSYIAPVTFIILGALTFWLTSHPEANRAHRRRWAIIGATAGLHIGALNLLLPVSTAVHGAMAALLFCVPLRIRRYTHSSSPGIQLAISESVIASVLFIALLFSAHWA